eukprot:scpid35049/ scgid30610/ Polycystin-2; Polycystic kidney disease 2 protein homolog
MTSSSTEPGLATGNKGSKDDELNDQLRIGKLPWYIHVLRLTVTCVVIPGVLASAGAIVEAIVYGTLNKAHFNEKYALYSSLIAIPLILVRWYWQWPKHLLKLEFAYYVIITTGFVAAVYSVTIAGPEVYRTGEHIRKVFGGPDNARYSDISTAEDIHNWLSATMDFTFHDNLEVSFGSRELPGRMALLSSMRVMQFRSPVKECSKYIKSLLIAGASQCYESRSQSSRQDTKPFSSLNYSYVNPSYVSLSLERIYASDLVLHGQEYSYPLAGHWVMFDLNFSRRRVLTMLSAMRNPDHPWIDYQTAMVALTFEVLITDSPKTLLCVVTFVIERTTSGLFVPSPPYIGMNNLNDVEIGDFRTDLPPGKCIPVATHKDFFTLLYLIVLPGVLYTMFRHVLRAHYNLSKYLLHPFTYSEIGWAICVLLSMIFRWRAVAFEHCDIAEVPQDIYGSNETEMVILFESLGSADSWFESRRVLGMAVFLHLFTALKFVVQLPALSGLIRTLQLAGRELTSFSLSFAIVFTSFVSMFYIVFSIEAPQYQSIAHCIGTLWLGMLGEFEISPELWRVKAWTLPVVIVFTFISVFVLLTVIVAIISDAHERARLEKEKAQAQRQRISDMLSNWKQRRSRAASARASMPSRHGGRANSLFRRLSMTPLLSRSSKASSTHSSSSSSSIGLPAKDSPRDFAGVVKSTMLRPPPQGQERIAEEESRGSQENLEGEASSYDILPAITVRRVKASSETGSAVGSTSSLLRNGGASDARSSNESSHSRTNLTAVSSTELDAGETHTEPKPSFLKDLYNGATRRKRKVMPASEPLPPIQTGGYKRSSDGATLSAFTTTQTHVQRSDHDLEKGESP